MKKILLLLCLIPQLALGVTFTLTADPKWAMRDDGTLCLMALPIYQTWLAAGGVPLPYVPQQVTMSQARIALSRAGYLNTIDAAIAGIAGQSGIEARIYWATSNTVDRTHPLVSTMGAVLGLTASQLDALFVTAAMIQ